VRVALRGFRALPFIASRPELLTAKEVESRIEFFLVDLISAGRNLNTGCHFAESAWLSGIDPDDERTVGERDNEACDLNNS
jgi:hypothetical protein